MIADAVMEAFYLAQHAWLSKNADAATQHGPSMIPDESFRAGLAAAAPLLTEGLRAELAERDAENARLRAEVAVMTTSRDTHRRWLLQANTELSDATAALRAAGRSTEQLVELKDGGQEKPSAEDISEAANKAEVIIAKWVDIAYRTMLAGLGNYGTEPEQRKAVEQMRHLHLAEPHLPAREIATVLAAAPVGGQRSPVAEAEPSDAQIKAGLAAEDEFRTTQPRWVGREWHLNRIRAVVRAVRAAGGAE